MCWNSGCDEQKWSKLRTVENLAKQIEFNGIFKDTMSRSSEWSLFWEFKVGLTLENQLLLFTILQTKMEKQYDYLNQCRKSI